MTEEEIKEFRPLREAFVHKLYEATLTSDLDVGQLIGCLLGYAHILGMSVSSKYTIKLMREMIDTLENLPDPISKDDKTCL